MTRITSAQDLPEAGRRGSKIAQGDWSPDNDGKGKLAGLITVIGSLDSSISDLLTCCSALSFLFAFLSTLSVPPGSLLGCFLGGG